MLSLEGEAVCEGAQHTFITGLAVLFACYIFNLQYQEEAACTVEFVQRRFLDINPERGSKTKKSDFKENWPSCCTKRTPL
ncbi:hypothetical protein UPYG_G00212580 [Umbra pygmaea]|uniref:Uncharacterized protein n=1 Tax=Umbra pygmaea TaxID=75934 RepID=A0ABD0WLN4_UMBPY